MSDSLTEPQFANSEATSPFTKWLFAPRSLAGLGVFRIALGLVGLQRFVLRWPHVDELYATGALMNPWGVGAQLNFPSFEFPVAMTLFSIFMVVMFCATIGLKTQLSCGLTCLMLIYFVSVNEVFQCHVDDMLIISFGFMAFSSAGHALSIDKWLSRQHGPTDSTGGWYQVDERGSIWAQRMIAISFASMYVFAPFLKLLFDGSDYFTGQNLAYAIQRWQFATPASKFIGSKPLLVMGMALTAILGELFMSFGLFVKKLRPFAMLIGIGMHLTILFTILIPPGLSLIMITSYITFMEPETWQRWLGGAHKLRV